MKLLQSVLVCLGTIAAILAPAGSAQSQTIPRELAQRFAGVGTTIFIGKLPPKARVSFDFPLPPRTRVVGASALPNTDPSYDYVSLYLSSQQPVTDVKAFYRQTFRGRGWRRGQTYSQTGFLPAGAAEAEFTDSLVFCRNQGNRETDVYLTLRSQQQTTLVDAQVNTYDSQGMGACDESSNREPPIPLLEAPEGSKSRVVENLSGFGQGNGGSVTVLETALSARALLEHYAQQLEGSGWRAQATARGDGAQFITYRFRDHSDAFIGTLQVVPLTQGRYSAQVTVVNP